MLPAQFTPLAAVWLHRADRPVGTTGSLSRRSLPLRVVAEGVEPPQQLAFLSERSCPEGQGYYFGRPVLAAEFAAVLGRHGTESARGSWHDEPPPPYY
jgi:predicted signal transduction protein with EAL and GGDEF domain